MDEYIIDLSGIRNLYELHEYFKKVFPLPDYYGMNMDALWDCLYLWFMRPTRITLKNEASAPKELSESVEILHQLLLDLDEKDPHVEVCFE